MDPEEFCFLGRLIWQHYKDGPESLAIVNPVVRVLRGGLSLRLGWRNRRTVQPERPCKAYPTTLVAKLDSKERKRGSEDGSRLPGSELCIANFGLRYYLCILCY